MEMLIKMRLLIEEIKSCMSCAKRTRQPESDDVNIADSANRMCALVHKEKRAKWCHWWLDWYYGMEKETAVFPGCPLPKVTLSNQKGIDD